MSLSKLQLSQLLAVYGAMLTDKQRDVVDMYCDCDCSLSEIAEEIGISEAGTYNLAGDIYTVDSAYFHTQEVTEPVTINGNGAIVNASRSILTAWKKREGVAFDVAARDEALRMREDLCSSLKEMGKEIK